MPRARVPHRALAARSAAVPLTTRAAPSHRAAERGHLVSARRVGRDTPRVAPIVRVWRHRRIPTSPDAALESTARRGTAPPEMWLRHSPAMDALVAALDAKGGVAHVGALRAAGFGKDRIERAAESGQVIRVRRGIYASPTAPTNLVRAARVGGRLAGASGAALHRLWIPPHERLVVEVPRGANRLRHPDRPDRTLTATDPVDVLWSRERRSAQDRIGLSSLQHCIAQCFRTLPASWAAAVLDSAVRTGVVDSIDLASIRRSIPRTFRRITRLADGRCESGWEFVLRSELAMVGVEARPQVRVPGTDLDRFDLLVGDRLAIEVDSEQYHGDRQARRRDRRRDARVTALGFLVLRFDAVMIESSLDDVLASVLRYVESGLHLTRR